jgi:hypothetical protein
MERRKGEIGRMRRKIQKEKPKYPYQIALLLLYPVSSIPFRDFQF